MGNLLQFQACQTRGDKAQICGFCMGLFGATQVGPFSVNCTGNVGPFQPTQLGTFCPAYTTPYCM